MTNFNNDTRYSAQYLIKVSNGKHPCFVDIDNDSSYCRILNRNNELIDYNKFIELNKQGDPIARYLELLRAYCPKAHPSLWRISDIYGALITGAAERRYPWHELSRCALFLLSTKRIMKMLPDKHKERASFLLKTVNPKSARYHHNELLLRWLEYNLGASSQVRRLITSAGK